MDSSPLLEVLTKAAGYLKEKGVPNARLDAELLLARILGVKRLDLYLQFDRPLSETELAGYRAWIRRRGKREPLQHILGDVEFRELKLKVDARSLIPRSETEILIDALKKNRPTLEQAHVLDIGTGTGAIALSIAKEFPQARVTASDLSQDCLNLARENAELNAIPVPELVLGSLFDPFPVDRRWDVIVSNPPYIGEHEIESLQPEVRDFDPRMALVGGEHGWEIPLFLLQAAYSRLNSGGMLIMEIDPSQFELLKEKALAQGWNQVQGHFDYQNAPRFIVLSQ